jgi:TRAP-type transport system periplasmic protein
MMHAIKYGFVATAVAAAAALAPAANAETISMTAVAAAPPTVSNVKATKEYFIPTVNKRLAASGKDFKIEWKEAYSSSLAKFTEVFETVEENIAQLGVILKNFEESKLPLEQYFYMAPFNSATPAQMTAIDAALREKLPEMNAEYVKHNQVFLGSGATESTDLFTTFPVKSVADMKGHKIGASGAMGQYLRGTGAVIVTSSMLDSFMNIKNGVYEGYPISITLAGPYRTYQSAKYYTKIGFGVTATSGLTVNKATWAKLPDFVKTIFLEETKNWAVEQDKIDQQRHATFVGVMKKSGVVFGEMSAAERRRWAMTIPNIAQEWASGLDKKGLAGTKVLKAYMDELRGREIALAREWDKE